jgi:hypothetical protein
MNQPTTTLGAGLAGSNPFNQQNDSTRTVHRPRPVFDESSPATPREREERRPARIHPNRTRAVMSDRTAARPQRLIHDANSSQLVNFPYALIAFVTLGGGLLGAGWGMVVDSVGLAATSSLVALIGVSFYGCSLFDE